MCNGECNTCARWKQAMEEGGGGTSAFRQAAFPQSYPNMIFWAHPERTKVGFFSPHSCGKIKWIFPDKQPDSSTSTSQKVNCSGLLLNIDLICKRPDAAGLNKCHLLPFQSSDISSRRVYTRAHPLWPNPSLQRCIYTVNICRGFLPTLCHNTVFFRVLLYLEASRTNVLIHINAQNKAKQ